MTSCSARTIERTDFFVPSEPGIDIFVRRLIDPHGHAKVPVLLMHGVRVPSIPSFDLDIENGSLAADIAGAGHPVYIMDARGFGRSTRPPSTSLPIARSNEVVRDIHAVVEHIRIETSLGQIACFGWATGGHWLGYHATLYPETISHIVFFITLYPQEPDHPLLGRGSHLEDPDRPGVFHRAAYGAYLENTREALLGWWESSIPSEARSAWRDPALVERYLEAAAASDGDHAEKTGSFRSPAGTMEDSYYLATGHRFWDASLITGHALVISAGRDFWARPSDRDKLVADLVGARSVEVLNLPQSTHYAHLDRPQHGRATMLSAMLAFFHR